jgi:integrase
MTFLAFAEEISAELGSAKKGRVFITMGKRANGEGSVYYRPEKKNKKWVASITLENGKRKQIYCETQAEAVKELRKLNQAKDEGTLITEDATLSQFLHSWLEDTAQMNVRPRTFIRYREIVTRHILPTLGGIKLQKLTPQHLQKLYKAKRQEGLAPGTVKNIHRLLHNALNDALRWELVSRNVSDALDAPRVPRQERIMITIEQAQRFLDVIKDDPLEALYVVAIFTGAREGEILGTRWEDIDLTKGQLQIRRTIARVPKQGFKVSEPKTPKSRRLIHLTPYTVEALKRHRTRQNEARQAAGPLWDDQGWVFCNSVGRPIEVASLLTRSFRPLLEKAGLPRIRFHDLRHAFASFLLALGVHPKVVQETLGHSQVSQTFDTYAHLLPTLHEEAINRLDDLLSNRG